MALTLVGLICLIVPGLVILGMYLLTFHFMVDRNVDIWQAMRLSRALAAQDYFGFTLLVIVLVVINALGVAFVGVGIAFTLPLTAMTLTAAYEDLQQSVPSD
jgi:uncharacterized membrane protein